MVFTFHIISWILFNRRRLKSQPYLLPILYSQYHACWCPCFSRHGIDQISQNIPSITSEQLSYVSKRGPCEQYLPLFASICLLTIQDRWAVNWVKSSMTHGYDVTTLWKLWSMFSMILSWIMLSSVKDIGMGYIWWAPCCIPSNMIDRKIIRVAKWHIDYRCWNMHMSYMAQFHYKYHFPWRLPL